MVDAVGTGALLAADSGPELPTVNDFLPPEILFQGTPFAINRIILIRIVATVVLLVVLGITAKRAKLIPGRWQGVVEMGIDFVRDSVVYQVMGELRGKRYVPMISTLFLSRSRETNSERDRLAAVDSTRGVRARRACGHRPHRPVSGESEAVGHVGSHVLARRHGRARADHMRLARHHCIPFQYGGRRQGTSR